jgi:hypothetical protein
MHMRHHVTNHLIISNDKDSNSENRIKLRVRDIERASGFLASLIFFHVNCRRPEWVVMGGWAIKDNVCVCVSVCGPACDCSLEIADAAFPVKVNLPVEKSPCACSVLLISSQLDAIKPVRGIVYVTLR